MDSTQQNRAAIFDLDKTILATSSALAMRKPLRKAGFITLSEAIVATISQVPFLLFGEADKRNDRIRNQLSRLATGWHLESLNAIVRDASASAMHPQCYAQALDLIQTHKAGGYKIVIATASPLPLVAPLAELIGADHTLATEVTIQNGLLTGEIADFNHGALKARAVKRLADREGWDLSECWAYSDSISDIDLFNLVGNPVAVNPDRHLRQVARENDWPIYRFNRTVELHPSRYIATGIAVGAITAAALAGAYFAFNSRGRA
ncbi:MAG: HAD family hydrolase [Actinomycetaceae bacterium]|nr:HAD family hydrolase [Actinomycetaceae bacterium]